MILYIASFTLDTRKKNSSVFECITNTRFQCKIRYIYILFIIFITKYYLRLDPCDEDTMGKKITKY